MQNVGLHSIHCQTFMTERYSVTNKDSVKRVQIEKLFWSKFYRIRTEYGDLQN